MLLFPHTSALYALPKNLEKKEILYLDGVRYACEMINLSYDRLCDSLIKLIDEDDPNTHRHLMTASVHDAWSIIDSADRLRALIESSDVLSFLKIPPSDFFKDAEAIRKLRNVIQHIDRLIPNHANADWPVWGGLRWFRWDQFPTLGVSALMLAGGHITTRPLNLAEPQAGEYGRPISNVLLFTKGTEVSLSDLHSHVHSMAIAIESSIDAMNKSAGSVEERFADIFIKANIDFGRE